MAVGNSHLDREVKCVDNVNLNKHDLYQNRVYLIKVTKVKELNETEKGYPAKLVARMYMAVKFNFKNVPGRAEY